ncbi:MAG: hypothetical protein KTV16_16005 [Acidimicrobiia bacterium]|nr:hypothetical protein [Acidimicrobiia bacterium]
MTSLRERVLAPSGSNHTLGHRGLKDDPLYGARKPLVSASGKIADNGRDRLRGLLDACDPHGEVRNAWHAKGTLRGIYDIADAKEGNEDDVRFYIRLDRLLEMWETIWLSQHVVEAREAWFDRRGITR